MSCWDPLLQAPGTANAPRVQPFSRPRTVKPPPDMHPPPLCSQTCPLGKGGRMERLGVLHSSSQVTL